jgi:hypothetical protein
MVSQNQPPITEVPSVFFDPSSQFKPADMLDLQPTKDILSALKTQMGPSFDHYEWWIFAHQNGNATPDCLQQDATKPRILIWMSDEFGTIPDHLMGHFHAVFKSYITHTDGHRHLFHFPAGYNSQVEQHPFKPIEEREIGVYFNGNLNRSRVPLYRELSNWLRYVPPTMGVPMIALLKRIPHALKLNFSDSLPGAEINFNLGFMNGSTRAYSECLSETKIALCPRGFVSAETYRLTEAMRAGCVVVTQPLPKMPIYEGSPIVEVPNWKVGLVEVQKLLQDQTRLKQLQTETVNWWHNMMCEEAVAARMARELSQLG